ncbi:hypothetical protein F5Y18DRAFT_10399 [Xylariaceae sp. FL1019]|nr:hypothetical protein F5Y18DRAFT_10399 [Xylariaceae sp. FL1019]
MALLPESPGDLLTRDAGGASDVPPVPAIDTFTRANVFGLFLALSLLLSVQPVGSFLFTKPTGRAGRVLFYLWKLNPGACIVDAIFIVAAFSSGVLAAIKHRHKDDINVWTRVRISLTAIFLLRKQCRVLDFSEKQNRGLSEPDSGVAGPDGSASTTPQSLGNMGRQSIDITDRPEEISLPTRSTAGLSTNEQRDALSLPSLESARSVAVRRLVERYNVSLTLFSSLGQQNAFPHTDFILSLFNCLSVILLIIRISSITANSEIMVSAWLMVVHLAIVQVFTLAQSQTHLEGAELQYLEDCAQTLSKMGDRSMLPTIRIILLPISLYSILEPNLAHWVVLLQSLYLNPFLLIFYETAEVYASLSPVWGLLDLSVDVPVYLIGFFIDLPDSASSASNSSLEIEESAARIIMNLVPLVSQSLFYKALNLAQSKDTLLAAIPLSLVCHFYMECYLFLPILVFPTRIVNSRWHSMIPLLYNLAFPVLVLAVGLIQYDDAHTFKPGWLDWLGR